MFRKSRESKIGSFAARPAFTAFESLESRQLMSADVSLASGVLRIDGSDSADKITVASVDRFVATRSSLGSISSLMLVHQFHVTVSDFSGT